MRSLVVTTVFVLFIIWTASLINPTQVLAQRPTPDIDCIDPATGKPNPDTVYVSIVNRCVDTAEFSSLMLNALIVIGVFAAIYRISMGFFLITTAEGDPSRLQEGREALTEAFLGVVVVAAAYGIIVFFQTVIPENWFVNLV